MKNQTLFCFRVFAIVIFTCLVSSGFGQTLTAKPDTKIAPRSNGFYEYLPEGYSAGSQKYPVIIFFHGLGETGSGNASSLPKVMSIAMPRQIRDGVFPKSFNVDGHTYRFIVIIPQFTNTPQNEDVEAVIDYAISHYRVDTSRIYLTGLSMGGGSIWYYAGASVQNSQRLTAIVPVCGAGWPLPSRSYNMAIANLPVWATHNDGDGTVPSWYTKDFVNNMNNYKTPPTPRAKMSIFPVGGHDAWSHTYDLNFKENGKNVYEWMLTFQKKSVLPVTDLKFSGKSADGVTTLAWTTSTESKNLGFTVERSLDGTKFDSLAFVRTQGDEGGKYAYVDQYALNGTSFYRLKVLAITGQSTYSNIVAIEAHGQNKALIFPNPVSDVLNLQTNYTPHNALLRIFDLSGRAVLEKVINGSGNHSIPVNLPSGMYSAILIENGKISLKESFIKK